MFRIGKACEVLGVSPQTVRKYVREGKLNAYESGGGQYLFDPVELDRFIGVPANAGVHRPEVVVFYTRSSSGKDSSLKSQREQLLQAYGEPTKIYIDKASGLKDDRKALTQLIKDAQNKKYTTLCITTEDRLTRFGYNYLKTLLEQNNITIKILHSTPDKTLQEELMNDFMTLIASFSGKFYRLRGWEQQQKLLEQAQENIKQKQQSH